MFMLGSTWQYFTVNHSESSKNVTLTLLGSSDSASNFLYFYYS